MIFRSRLHPDERVLSVTTAGGVTQLRAQTRDEGRAFAERFAGAVHGENHESPAAAVLLFPGGAEGGDVMVVTRDGATRESYTTASGFSRLGERVQDWAAEIAARI